MAKPKTKGDPIQVRLPLDVDASVRAKALKQDTTPASVVSEVVTRAARAKVAVIGAVIGALDGHTHTKKTVNGSGLHVCECGALRGVDEVWR